MCHQSTEHTRVRNHGLETQAGQKNKGVHKQGYCGTSESFSVCVALFCDRDSGS